MAQFTREEIESALDYMDELRVQSSEQGDWSIWAQCLAEDVEFFDEVHGTYSGKRAVTDFVVRVHAPFPNLRYERDWTMIDTDRAEVIFQQHMLLPEPEGYEGDPFAIKIWSRHRYAGDNLWSYKHDAPLTPSEKTRQVFAAWMAAGGKFAAEPLAAPQVYPKPKGSKPMSVVYRDSIQLDAPPEKIREFLMTPERILDYYPGGTEGGVIEPGAAIYCRSDSGVSLLQVDQEASTAKTVVMNVHTAGPVEPPHTIESLREAAFFSMVEDWHLERRGSGTLLTKTWRDITNYGEHDLPLQEMIVASAKSESEALRVGWNRAYKDQLRA